ncbi:alanine--tRNA ligase [Hamiltosporidium tvaerminnensis]|uniref:Alanine--tRNA ligase n=1 Tax=Hamiltosporidium tvaerminnensis TaxID=1176355 RepID=A0A4Q9LZA8_9MICR|nr:alanine--tRNA ligase [Hamiltosporidium tvaerminnensis]TBU19778.1 alanine--tRNA ligase [Hamiltosporidium tvaerminnensis]
MWTSQDLRRSFISFFKSHNHTHIPSSPIVPNDTSLLFTNSGMVQFKKIFLSTETNTFFNSLKRACSIQRCLRAGGKHNDLEDVGKDTYHHTYFEMLGNWSFNDYFKEKAIDLAYQYLVSLNIEMKNIYVTYYQGTDKIPTDHETKTLWLKYLPPERILPFEKENFWEMGDTGPCGPCTEIHYDRIGNRFVPELVNKDDPTVIEIWNIVFIEFERQNDNSLIILKNKSIDTGMGMERVLSILNNTFSNYMTDLFLPLFSVITEFSPINYIYKDSDCLEDVGCRVLADHGRTISVCIKEIRPSNEGRGYVLRRVIRRAIRYMKKMELKEGFLCELVRVASKITGVSISEEEMGVIMGEEVLFSRSLDKGLGVLEKVMESSKNKGGVISGSDIFLLYDTYGFPSDLTEIICKENNMVCDLKGFNDLFKEQREITRVRSKKCLTGRISTGVIEQLGGVIPTDDSFKYRCNGLRGSVLFTIENGLLIPYKETQEYDNENSCKETPCNQVLSKETINNNLIGLISDKTPFFSESGGQVSDIGKFYFMQKNSMKIDECVYADFRFLKKIFKEFEDTHKHIGELKIIDVQKYGSVVVHFGYLKGKLSEDVFMVYDGCRRECIRKNHSGTHLLNYFLRRVLFEEERNNLKEEIGFSKEEEKDSIDLKEGNNFNEKKDGKKADKKEQICGEIRNEEKILNNLNTIAFQMGSEVSEEKLRFDFSSLKNLTLENLKKVEFFVNSVINEELKVEKNTVKIENVGLETIRMKEEDYPGLVRKIEVKSKYGLISELCGGTHVDNTKEIGKFRILSEGSVSFSVRRIIAVTGESALERERKATEVLNLVREGKSVDTSILKELPLFERLEIENFIKENERIKLEERKKIVNFHIKNIQESDEEFIIYEVKCEDLEKSVILIAAGLVKNKKSGVVWGKNEKEIFCSFRCENAVEKTEIFLKECLNVKVGGKGRIANGKALLTDNWNLKKFNELKI